MRIFGVVAEFNPFHHGHRHLLQAARERGADYVLCAMSGAFVQRGQPAVMDKWSRAREALNDGADLIVELPAAYCLSTAEWFAAGAVGLLDGLSATDLIFGSECADADLLFDLARLALCEPPEYKSAMRRALAAGHSHPAARAIAARRCLGEVGIAVSSPNDILGVEYIKALLRIKSGMRVHAAGRTVPCHAPAQNGFASASALRRMIGKEPTEALREYMPTRELERQIALGRAPIRASNLELIVLGRLRAGGLSHLAQVTEGLDQRLIRAAKQSGGFEEFLRIAATRRYPATRISRIAFCAALNIPKEAHTAPAEYARIIGFRRDAGDLLAHIKRRARLPLISKPADAPKRAMWTIDRAATDLQMLGAPDPAMRRADQDLTTPMVIV